MFLGTLRTLTQWFLQEEGVLGLKYMGAGLEAEVGFNIHRGREGNKDLTLHGDAGAGGQRVDAVTGGQHRGGGER